MTDPCQDPSNFSDRLRQASLSVLHLTQSQRSVRNNNHNNNASIKHTLVECSSYRAVKTSYGNRSDSCLRAHFAVPIEFTF